jgi:hypothetical protein
MAPPEYRPVHWAVPGLAVALGCLSGRVLIFQFSAKQRHSALHPIAEGAPLPIDGTFEETIVDEDEAGYEMVEQPCQPTPAVSCDPRKLRSSLSSSRSLPPADYYIPAAARNEKPQCHRKDQPMDSSEKRSSIMRKLDILIPNTQTRRADSVNTAPTLKPG